MNLVARCVLMALAVAPSLAAPAEVVKPAAAGVPACRGRLSGALSGTFDCTFVVKAVDDATVVFEIRPKAPIEGVAAYAPGSFQIPRPVRRGTYTLETLGLGKASVADQGKTLYTAHKTMGTRGQVTLTLGSVTKGADGLEVLRGLYSARLVPAGAGKSGEVVVDVEF